MGPTEELKKEHEGILLALNILQIICNQMDKGISPSIPHLEQMVDFFQIFVDKCHHGKEEKLMFPAIGKAGISWYGGPIGVMLAEHAKGRSFLKGMEEAINQFKAGKKGALSYIEQNARNYISLIRKHIEKENILFREMDKAISKEKQQELLAGFEKLETERIGAGKHEEFHKMLYRLKGIYLSK